MGKWNIYHSDGSIVKDGNGIAVEVHSLEYNDEWMGECSVTADITSSVPIDFRIGDYIEYRGERFEINYDPGKSKTARVNSYGEAFKYSGVKFMSLSYELVRCDFLDVVLSDNNLHYTALPKFSFYVESLDDLLDRIQANVDELYGKGVWKLYSRNKERSVGRGCDASEWSSVYGDGIGDSIIESASVSVDNQTCWEALALVNSTFDVNFIVRGRNVYVGTEGIPTTNIFKYGKGNGLYEIAQTADSEQTIVTRLRAYGSTKNLPSHYYADLGGIPFMELDSYEISSSSGTYTVVITLPNVLFDGIFIDIYYSAEALKNGNVSFKISDAEYSGKIVLQKITDSIFASAVIYVSGSSSATSALRTALSSGVKKLSFTSGVNRSKFDSDQMDYSYSRLPNNMACDRLMLPGFPKQSLSEWWSSLSAAEKSEIYDGEKEFVFSDNIWRPYVDSPNLSELGVRPASVYFDTEDKKEGIDEIYPTIEEMEVGGQRIDEIYIGSDVSDNGRVDSETIDNTYIYLRPEINFNLNEYRDESFAISMKDGKCAGRSFEIASCKKMDDNSWRLGIKRVPDFGLWFPYSDFQIEAGDHFVLTGLTLPDEYVEAASRKLLKYALAYLSDNDYTSYVYEPKVDEIYMARQHDEAIADKTGETRSLYMTLKAGDIMRFSDEDFGIVGNIAIDKLSIKESDGNIPEYSITLREEKQVGTIQKIQNKISSIESGSGKVGSAVYSQMNEMVLDAASKRFLSKTKADTALGRIDFRKGLSVVGKIIESLTLDGGFAGVGNNDTSDSRVPTEKAVARAFLRKDINDTASFLIRFLKGLEIGDGSWYFDETGKLVAKDVTTKNLEVQGAAHFFQLIIDQVRSVGGRIVLSLASCNIAHVEYLAADGTTVQEGYSSDTAYFRCYFRADDNNASTTNNFSPGDLAICQTFNIGEGEHSDTANTFYWRKVTYCSYSALTYDFDRNGNKYYFINLSNRLGEYADNSNAIPTIGDSIVQLGNWSDAERASAIVLSAYDDGWLDTEIKAPSIAQYVGVGMGEADRWNMAKCRYTWLARNGNQITGNLRVVTAEGTKEVTEYVSSEVATQTEAIVDTKVTEKTAELRETVNGLSSTVSQHTTEINTISGNLQTTTALVNSHTTKINQNASSISAHATSLQTVQQNISDIETQFDSLSDTVDSQQTTIDGLPLKTDAELAEYKGEILVESKQIALEVSEITDVRRNMLMGTQFWKNIGYDTDGYRVNGSGATLIRRTADTINGHNSLEISSSSTSNTYGGIYFLNIPVEAGKSYTISVWAKRMSSSLGNGAWMILHYKANSEQGTPTWQESQRLVTTANTIGEWVLIKKTITPKAGDYFVNVIFCLTSSGKIRIAEPMMEESEEYTAWSPSPKDYAYVMGNMLPDTDMLKIVSSGEGLTQVNGRTADTDEAGIYTAKGTATATYVASSSSWTAGYNTLITMRKAFSKGYSYILSFYARRTSAASDYAGLCVNFGNNVLIAEHSTGVSRFSEDQGSSPYSGYVKIKNVPTTWTRYWVHVITNDNVTLTPQIYIEVTGGTVGSGGNISGNTGTFLVKKPKLEYGAVVTEWTASTDDLAEEETIANQLHKTGINITQGTIRLTAKNTIIDGDLYLRGVLVENYGQTERYSLVICDTVQNKSVSVQQATVVLPMISPQTITSSHVTGQDIAQVTVAAVKEAGVKLTIAAKYDASVAKWSMATAELYAWNKNAMGYFHSCCTKVFADPRIASRANYTAPDVATIRPEGGGATESGYEGGVFVCNGRRGRVLLLMPGQTLHLTSAIETINGTDHLLWYVDNGSEFVSLNKSVWFHGDNDYDIGFTYGAGSAWPLEAGSLSSEYQDSLFGARVLDSVYSETEDVLDIQL